MRSTVTMSPSDTIPSAHASASLGLEASGLRRSFMNHSPYVDDDGSESGRCTMNGMLGAEARQNRYDDACITIQLQSDAGNMILSALI